MVVSIDDYLNLIPPPNNMAEKFKAWLGAGIQPLVDVTNLNIGMGAYFNIETATGAQLDILGDILGRKRLLDFEPTGIFANNKPVPYKIHYDQPGIDLTIAQEDGKRVYIIGWELIADVAFTVTFKSGSTVLNTFNFGEYSGPRVPFRPVYVDFVLGTEVSQPLIMNADEALPDHLMYIIKV
jgi:hypothetical protein